MTSNPPPDPLIGQVVDDRYRILRPIGRGGMGQIYEAQSTRLGGRLCAVKVLLPEFVHSGTAAARFAREAEVAARVKHPNAVEILDTGTAASGLRYIAMELLTGEGLDRTLRRGPLPWPRAQHITLQICRALAAAHAAKVVHRDMKPENCFRITREEDEDFIKVLDFGIAKLLDTADKEDDPRLTSTGSVIGTYAYMAIEQIDGEAIDHRADIWAVGVILHELLTGQLPFRGVNQGQIWKAIHEHDLLPMRSLAPQMHIPEPAEAVVRQALARSLDDRYPSMTDLARAVARVQADGTLRAVTGKLALPTLPVVTPPDPRSSTLVSSPTEAAAPRLSQRTDPVSMHGLTELMPASAVVDTDETALAEPPDHITRPEARTEIAPPREPQRTELAPQPQTQPTPIYVAPAPAQGRRPLLLLALAGVPLLAVATLWLTRTTEETPRVATEIPPPAPAPPAIETPTPTPTRTATPPPEPTPAPTPVDPPPVPTTKSALPAKTPAKPASFQTRAKQELRKLQSQVKAEACFAKNPGVGPLNLTITVSAATGVARLTMPRGHLGAAITTCLERALKSLTFPKGAPGDADYKVDRTVKP